MQNNFSAVHVLRNILNRISVESKHLSTIQFLYGVANRFCKNSQLSAEDLLYGIQIIAKVDMGEDKQITDRRDFLRFLSAEIFRELGEVITSNGSIENNIDFWQKMVAYVESLLPSKPNLLPILQHLKRELQELEKEKQLISTVPTVDVRALE